MRDAQAVLEAVADIATHAREDGAQGRRVGNAATKGALSSFARLFREIVDEGDALAARVAELEEALREIRDEARDIRADSIWRIANDCCIDVPSEGGGNDG